MATYLDRILARHREVAGHDRRPLDVLIRDAQAMPPTRGFAAALGRGDELHVIAEIKRRSPSKGDLHAELDPAVMARRYETGGASCLSVLTDVEHFGGSPVDLREARAACSLPVLRKDFTVSPRDVCDARTMGADCLLLIAAALDPVELAELHALAVEVGLDVLVEIHDEAELEVALGVSAHLIGVNQRDLVTFQVDHERAVRMGSIIPDGVVKVAESGVRDRTDASSLHRAGYHAVLVGETLVTAADPSLTIRELRGIG
ncbi:MAG: indole-3-glycerol phosphate synthase TrpC [Actinobacteria bacterium]|nr:indole-3-glycerol phosphate synthase TrpC [Actinomycetota bacterium]